MNSTIGAIIVSLIGGVVIGMLAHWMESRYEHTRIDASDDRETIYSRKWEALVGSIVVFVAWMAILWFFGWLLIYELTDIKPSDEIMAFYPFGVLISGALLYLFYGLRLKCDRCDRRILMQDSEHQKYAKKHWLVGGWSHVVIDILFRKKFQCMSCGKNYVLK